MKELSPFLNEDDRESTFEYVLELMDDDLVRVSGDDSDEDEVENDKENMDDSSENDGFFDELSMDNDNQREVPCDNNEICDAELNRYRNIPKLPMKDDPLQWWEEHKHKFPILYRLAMKYLSIPATSAPSERVWSIASHIITTG